MNRLLGLVTIALVAQTSADKGLDQYSSAGGFGGSGFGGAPSYSGGAGGFGDDGLGGEGGGDNLEEVIPGVPGDDYPIFAEVPETSFLCEGQTDGGYYADPEAECQVFHICAGDGTGGLTKYSFLCPNGTLFNQQYFVCDWWFNVDCSLAEEFYSLNDEIAAEREANSPDGGQGQYGQGGPGGQAGYGKGGAGGRRGGAGGRKSGGSKAAASSPRGSYSAPAGDSYSSGASAPAYTSPAEFGGNGFGPADGGYGAPGGFGGEAAGAGAGYGAPAGGYGAPAGYSSGGLRRRSRTRNARELPLAAVQQQQLDIQEPAELQEVQDMQDHMEKDY